MARKWHRLDPNGTLEPNALERHPELTGFSYTNPHTKEAITVQDTVCCLFPSSRVMVREGERHWSVDVDALLKLYQKKEIKT